MEQNAFTNKPAERNGISSLCDILKRETES